LRVLMLSQFYPPLIGGEERYVRDLSIQLAARGHEVSVATLRHPDASPHQVDNGVNVFRIQGTLQRADWLFTDVQHRHVPPFPDPELVSSLQRLVGDIRPDVVHAHNWLVSSFLPIKKSSRARLVLTLHDCSRVCSKKSFMFANLPCSGPGFLKCMQCATEHYGALKGVPTTAATWMMRRSERHLVDMFLPVSQAVAVANNLGCDGVPFHVIPNFVPDTVEETSDAFVKPYTAQLPPGDYVLFVGAGAYKGTDVVLRAYADLHHPPPLVMIGPDPLPPSAIPAGVHMFQGWPHAAVMAAWKRSLLGLVPSTCMDACPTVVLEAMAASRPVIASRIGGVPDLVADGETGILVEPGDAIALRHAIQRLVANPEMGQQMGRAALERVRQFRASAVVPRIEHVYRELVA